LAIPEASLARIIHSLIRQAEYVAEHLPHRDPPNNHLIGEAATLYTFAVLWPVLEKSKAWRGECENILKEEMKRQVLPDGMHFENAFNYHAYVLDFYLLYVYARCLEGEKPDPMLLDGITQLAKNLLAFRSPSGRVPRFGDDSLTEFLTLKPLREIESRRFTESHTMTEIVRLEFAEVLAGQDWGMDLMQIGMPATSSIHCRDSGFSAFRAKSSHLVYAAGPEHPRPFSDGHLHSEAGSFELEIAGVPVFIDSGTYLYGYDGASREHFRGARAHNTLLIDDLDPMTGAGTFKWEGIKRGRTIWFSSQGDCKAVGSRQVLPSSRDEFYHERILVQLEDSVWILVDRLSAPHCDAGGALHRSRVLFHTPLPPDRFDLLDGFRLGMRLDVSDETPADSGSARRGAYILHGFSSAGYGRQLISDRADRRSWYSPAYGELRYGTTIDVCVDFMESLTLVHSLAGEDVRVACHPREDERVEVDIERNNKQERLTVYFMPTRIDWNGKVLEESR
ncbi:MAG: alginate lyase family protein, partial [Candidatus Krumholzibacteria bacterium]